MSPSIRDRCCRDHPVIIASKTARSSSRCVGERQGPDTVYYSPAPTYHAAPLRFGGIVHAFGGTLVMSKRFDAEQSLATIQEYGVTHSQWVPTMFVRMLKLDPAARAAYDVSTLQCAVHAAAPCPVDVKQQMIDWWGPILFEYYGATEGIGITLIKTQQWLEKRGSVGKAGLGIIRICDEAGAELPVGRIGTVYFERDHEREVVTALQACRAEHVREPGRALLPCLVREARAGVGQHDRRLVGGGLHELSWVHACLRLVA